MGTITRGSFAKALWPGINKWYGMEYTEWPVEYSDIFTTNQSNQAYEEDVLIQGFGLASVKNEGDSIEFDDAKQAWVTRYTNVTYAKGFVVTREMYEDKLYNIMEKRSKALAFSMRQTKETVGANVLNRAENGSYVGGDGKTLFSTIHPLAIGGTWANILATDADLSESSLEQACIDIEGFVDDRALKISAMPHCLIVPRQLGFEAERILKSYLQNDSANNALNALMSRNSFPGGTKINHYLTDTDAWFIKTNVPDGMKMFQRRTMQFDMDNDFDTENAKYKSSERDVFGWTDPRGLFGSPGA